VENTRSAAWQPSLFELDEPSPDQAFSALTRRELAGGAWLDHAPGWLAGAAPVFERLHQGLAWRGGEQVMYGQKVGTPRVSSWWGPGSPPPPVPDLLPLLEQIRSLLGARYDRAFTSIGFNLYRHGADSVAWHGDRVARDHSDATIAIISVGARRPFRLRPKGGGRALRFELGAGDLLVMGGTCQSTWDHSVPKVARAAPRISVTYRHGFGETNPYEPDLGALAAVAR
jgi:alkylated DNA repair dioxygenase AlkB